MAVGSGSRPVDLVQRLSPLYIRLQLHSHMILVHLNKSSINARAPVASVDILSDLINMPVLSEPTMKSNRFDNKFINRINKIPNFPKLTCDLRHENFE